MDREAIMAKLKQVIQTVLETDDEIDDQANFIFDLGADSMQSVKLVAAFEEAFDIEMDEDKALQIQTVSDAADFIAEYL